MQSLHTSIRCHPKGFYEVDYGVSGTSMPGGGDTSQARRTGKYLQGQGDFVKKWVNEPQKLEAP